MKMSKKINQGSVIIFITFCVNFVMCIMHYDNRSKIYSDSKIVFPENVETEIQEIPLELMRRLNEVSSIEEFWTMMVGHESESIGISDRMGIGVERSSVTAAKSAKCMPELQTVPLKPEKTSLTVYYPSCTRVKRCGGCCYHELTTCRPVDKEIVLMSVVVGEYRGGPNFFFKEKKIVEVEQHTKCECGCKIQPEDCTKFQKYSPGKCKCECTNTDKERKCYKEAPKKIWDPNNCSCVCKEELECGSGFNFDPFSCSCVPSRGRNKPSFLYEID